MLGPISSESYTEQYLYLVLFIMLFKVRVLTFKSVINPWYESYVAVLSFVTVYFSVQGGCSF